MIMCYMGLMMFAIVYDSGRIEKKTAVDVYKSDKVQRVEKSNAPYNNTAFADVLQKAQGAYKKTENNLIQKAYSKTENRSHFSLPETHVRQIMSYPVVYLHPDDPIKKALAFFQEKKFRHIPIVNHQLKIMGMLSDRDVFSQVKPLDMNAQINTIMTSKVLTAQPMAEIRHAASFMIKEEIGALPIVDDAGFLRGIVSRSDILKTFVKQVPVQLLS